MPILIATTKDVLALNSLVNTAYRGESSKKGWTTEANLLSGNRIDEETLAGYFATPGVYILKYIDDTENIQGCVYLEDRSDKLYLGMLSVNPELQASGIGRGLLDAADKFAIEHNLLIISITVISTRTELIDWYKRRGYIPTGEELPFHADEKFGKPNQVLKLVVLEKKLNC